MNVLLLGNGFDINYGLPTKYSNFLNITNYLIKNPIKEEKYVGDILSKEALHNIDGFIKECYKENSISFNKTPIDFDKINELINLSKNNMWFSYLIDSFNKDVGWIDFEKEISFVLSCFKKSLPQNGHYIYFKHDQDAAKYVIKHFGFLIDEEASKRHATIGTQVIKKEYCIEYPLKSGVLLANMEKIVNTLYKELTNLSAALKLYLQCFVENVCDLLKEEAKLTRFDIFRNISNTITFNYTNTYEILYFKNNVFHIHGNLNDNIVLGINPDESDSIDSVNTSFLCFKKYYQRTMCESDYDYCRWITETKESMITYRLIVMGHSLDITDKDIVIDLFALANEIIILYHDAKAKSSYISNLVMLYGKEGFDSLRKNKSLTFLPLDADFTELATKMEKEAFDNLTKDLYNKF